MRILLVSPHFYPENFKCNQIAFELAKRGYEVTVLSDIPNYPKGKFFDGYGIFKKRVETVNGVKIIRSLVIPRGKGSGLRLALNYLSFAFFASFIALYLAIFKKFDAVLVHETSPITVGIPALLVKKIQRIPFYFWVLDLWPESLEAAGGIKQKNILGFFRYIAKLMYKNSDKILISSNGFKKSIKEKGDFENKIVYFPNWADKELSQKIDYPTPYMPSGFKIMFAGNIGEAQDFDHIMEAAKLLKDEKQIHFIFVGDGRKRPWVQQNINQYQLDQTVHWVGRHPLESMPSFFEQADAMLVSLKDNLVFNLTAPAKIQAYMHAKKPIIAMLNGEGGEIIEDAQCGFSTTAGNAKGLAELIKKVSLMEKEQLDKLGANGYSYCEQNFNFSKQMNILCNILDRTN